MSDGLGGGGGSIIRCLLEKRGSKYAQDTTNFDAHCRA